MGERTPRGPGWWLATDGTFYPPEHHPFAAAAERARAAEEALAFERARNVEHARAAEQAIAAERARVAEERRTTEWSSVANAKPRPWRLVATVSAALAVLIMAAAVLVAPWEDGPGDVPTEVASASETPTPERTAKSTSTTTPTTTTTAPDPWTAAFESLGMDAPGVDEREAFETMCTAPMIEVAKALQGDASTAEIYRAGFSVACPENVPTVDTALVPFGDGYPREVPLSSVPDGPRQAVSYGRPDATTAVEVAPGVWTTRGLSTTVLQDALEGSFDGYCSDIAALEQRIGDQRGGACW
jgi:hypothetical protein